LEIKDLILAPFYLIIIYFVTIIIRNNTLKDSPLRKYFIPGLTVKIIGSIAAGLVYHFYYGGGDTFFFYQGTTIIWGAFLDNPAAAFKIIFANSSSFHNDIHQYTSQIWTYRDSESFFVVRIAAFIGLFSFNSYVVISLFFAVISFIGTWALYRVFVDLHPKMPKQIAIAVLFIPSVFFWGSGLFKDTITFAGLGLLTFALYYLFFKRKKIIQNILLIALCSYVVGSIKVYILLSFLPGFIFWLALHYSSKVKLKFVRMLTAPILISFSVLISYFIVNQLGEEFEKYSLPNILKTAGEVQWWHNIVSEQDQGSGYSLGDYDPSTFGMIKKFPVAVNVTLFRPYIWESSNAVMMISALESLAFLVFTIYILIKSRVYKLVGIINSNPEVFFCLFFALIFAFSIGFTSYNFGALARYKIPGLPFYLIALFIINYHLNKSRKLEALEETA